MTEENFVCLYCGREFKDKISLTKHKRYYCELSNERVLKIKPIAKCEPYICERCGKSVTELYGSGRFCSRVCANTRLLSEDTKKKVSIGVNKHFDNEILKDKICVTCRLIYHSKDHARKLCFDCLPQTIKKSKVDKIPLSILDVSKRTAEKIIRRMLLPCSCCGVYVEGVNWDIHHIIAKENGGTDDMHNLTYICPNCHRIAHTNKDLLYKELVPLDTFLENYNKNWKDYYYGYKDTAGATPALPILGIDCLE